MWQTPVTDRTVEDVDFARAHRDDDQLHKGAQSFVAWNRLVGNMHHLAGMLNSYGYQVALKSRLFAYYSVFEWNALGQTVEEIKARGRTAKDFFTNFDAGRWQLGDIPFNYEIEQMKTDLETLRYALYFPVEHSAIPIPALPYSHFQKINDIEEITYILNKIIQSITPLYYISGTFQSGQLSYLPRFLDIEIIIEYMTVQEFNDLRRTVAQIEAEGRTAATFFRRL